MSTDNTKQNDSSDDLDAFYEAIASQEEIYLEEVEEEIRAILICEDPSPSEISGCILPLGERRQEVDISPEGAMEDSKENLD